MDGQVKHSKCKERYHNWRLWNLTCTTWGWHGPLSSSRMGTCPWQPPWSQASWWEQSLEPGYWRAPGAHWHGSAGSDPANFGFCCWNYFWNLELSRTGYCQHHLILLQKNMPKMLLLIWLWTWDINWWPTLSTCSTFFPYYHRDFHHYQVEF